MNEFEEYLFKIIKAKDANITREDFSKWHTSTSTWAPENYKRSSRWVEETIIHISNPLDDIEVDRFLINSYGLLIDIASFLDKKVGIYKLLGFPSIREVRRAIIRSFYGSSEQLHQFMLIEVYERYQKFMEIFTDEELFATAYFRNTYCHPSLDGYSVKIKLKKDIVIFDAEQYVQFLKLSPTAELELVKSLYFKLKENIAELEHFKIQLNCLGGG